MQTEIIGGASLNEKKINIINHYEETIEWVNCLRELSEDSWGTPIEEGKWTIAEVIGHLIPWDEFVLNQRIPYLIDSVELPKSPKVELVNQQAAELSRSRSKDDTINQFIKIRKCLVAGLRDMPDDDLWEQDLFIGGKSISLRHYFAGLMEHDNHHFRQINRLL